MGVKNEWREWMILYAWFEGEMRRSDRRRVEQVVSVSSGKIFELKLWAMRV